MKQILFLLLCLPCLVCAQTPQWIQPWMAATHPVSKADSKIPSSDFTVLLSDNRVAFIGFIGNDYRKMGISFRSVSKISDTEYQVLGTSSVRGNVCSFSGNIQIENVRELNEFSTGLDDCMKGKIRKQGICIARYTLAEDKSQKGSGVFTGIALLRWYVDMQNRLLYDDIDDYGDSYANNQFAGMWRSYATGKEKRCAWGQYRIPDCGDLDCGAAEFSVNPKYLENGWKE